MTAFFGSVPRNHILKNVIDQIILNVQNKYYGGNRLEPTGPVLFGKEIQNILTLIRVDIILTLLLS